MGAVCCAHRLHLDGNPRLSKLPRSLPRLTKLQDLDLSGCEALPIPPHFKCPMHSYNRKTHLILELFVHLEEAARDEGSLQRMERVKVVFLGNGRVGKVRHTDRHSRCRMESLNAHTHKETQRGQGLCWIV